MNQGPLMTEMIDAGAELAREFEKYEPVKVAFWLKASDDDHRFLYIASDRTHDTNIDVSYSEILRLTEKMQSTWLDPFRVKLINCGDPLAKAALEIHQRFPGRLATRFGGNMFGGVSVDDVYIYPSPLPAGVS